MAGKHIIKISGKFYGVLNRVEEPTQPDEPSNPSENPEIPSENPDAPTTPSVPEQPETPVVPSEPVPPVPEPEPEQPQQPPVESERVEVEHTPVYLPTNNVSGRLDIPTRELPVGSTLAVSYIPEEPENINVTNRYAYISKYQNDIFGLQHGTSETDLYLVKLDPVTYEPIEGIRRQFNNQLGTTALYVDELYVYITSSDINRYGLNKVVIIKKDNINDVKQIGGTWNWGGDNYHPAGIASDATNVYIISGKTRNIRIYKKETIANRWDNLGTNTPADAYIKLPVSIPHGNNITVAAYATNNILDVSWGGTIYRYDVSDIHSGAYSSFDTGKTACDVIKAPFEVSVINRIVENNNYILLQVGTRIIIMEKDKYLNKDFTIFVASVPSTDSEHSLIDIEIV